MEQNANGQPSIKRVIYASVAIAATFIISYLSFERVKQIGWSGYDLAKAGLLDQYEDNSIKAITFDSDNNLWVATYDYSNRNAVAVQTRDGIWKTYPHSDPKDQKGSVSAIVVDKDKRVWVGTRAKLDVLTPEGSWETMLDEGVSALTIDGQGRLWAGMQDKLGTFTNGEWQFFTSQNSEMSKFGAQALAVDQQGQLWTTDWFGIDILKSDGNWTKDAIGVSSPFSDYQALAIDEQGRLWVGSLNGLDVCNNGACEQYTAYNSGLGINPNSHNEVYDLAFDKDNKLWVSTYSNLRILDLSQVLSASLLQGLLVVRWILNVALFILTYALVVLRLPVKNLPFIGALGGGLSPLILSTISPFQDITTFIIGGFVIGSIIGMFSQRTGKLAVAYFGSSVATFLLFICFAVVFGAK